MTFSVVSLLVTIFSNTDECGALHRVAFYMRNFQSQSVTDINQNTPDSYPFTQQVQEELTVSCANPICFKPSTRIGSRSRHTSVGEDLAIRSSICNHLLHNSIPQAQRQLQDDDIKPHCMPMAMWGDQRALEWSNSTLLSSGIPKSIVLYFLKGLTDEQFDGEALSSINSDHLAHFGIPFGWHARILRLVDESKIVVNGNMLATQDPCSKYYGTQPMQTTFDMFIQKLTEVNEQVLPFCLPQSVWPNTIYSCCL
jgi:hypothetical protein